MSEIQKNQKSEFILSMKERCQICGKRLRYTTQIDDCKELVCIKCGKKDLLNIYCPDGHYICKKCENK